MESTNNLKKPDNVDDYSFKPLQTDFANSRIRQRPGNPLGMIIGDYPNGNYFDVETDGTIVFNGDATVWNDANVGGLALRPGVTNPPVTQWVDNVGANTGIYGLGFAVNDESNGSIEIPHNYKEGSNIAFHIHWGANDAPSGTDYVKWQLKYFVDSETTEPTTPPATTIVIETAYDTRYEHKRSDFPAITGTSLKIGDQINFNIKRIAATGDAYAGVAIAETIGFHYEVDTAGSRQILTK